MIGLTPKGEGEFAEFRTRIEKMGVIDRAQPGAPLEIIGGFLEHERGQLIKAVGDRLRVKLEGGHIFSEVEVSAEDVRFAS